MRQATFDNAASAGTARRTSSPDVRHRLLLHLASRRRGEGHLSDGFTLIELMIVIVIVAILMAIALPNFLSQSNKAKMTEARTLNNAALKEAQAAWIESGTSGMTTWATAAPTGSCPISTKTWLYTSACAYPATGAAATAAAGAPAAMITATGSPQSGDLAGKIIVSAINLETGRLCTYTGTGTTAIASLPATCSFS